MILTLTGSNDFAIKQTLDALTGRFTATFGDAGLERVDGESLEPVRLPELLQGASLFAPQRLVVLKNAGSNKPVWELLGDWLERVPSETTLVVVEPSADKRTRTYKQLKKLGELKELAEPQPPQLATWLQKTAGELGGHIDAKTAHYLVQRTGTDQWRLWQELQKLVSYNTIVTIESIDQLVESTPQASAFDLLDAALGGKPGLAGGLLAKLSANEDPYKLFGLLVSQVHTLALVHSAAGKSTDVVAKEGGIHPFVVRKMQGTARGLSSADIQRVIRHVALLDTQLKSTGADPWMLLGRCLQKIAARAV